MSKMEKKHSGNNQLSDPRLAIAPNIFPRFTRPLQKTHFKSDNRVCERRQTQKIRQKQTCTRARSLARPRPLRRQRQGRNERKQNKPESTCGLAAVTV